MNIESKIKHYYAFKFLQNLHFFSAVLMVFYTHWAGLTEQSALLIQSWFMFCVSLLELPTGVITDKFGRRLSLILGAGSAATGLFIYALYGNVYWFLLGETILALAMTFISGADEAWLIDTLDQHKLQHKKTEIVGKGQSLMFVGMMLGSLLGSVIAQFISLPATMYLSAIPAVLLLVVAFRLPEPSVHRAGGEMFKWRQAFLSLSVLLKNRLLLTLSLNLILVAVSAYFILWLYQPLLTQIGVDIAWFGAIHATLLIVETIISHRFGWLEKKIGLHHYLQLTALIVAGGFILTALTRNLATVLVLVIVSGSVGLTRRYFALGYFHELVSAQYRASIASSFSLLFRFATALANLIVGWLFVQSAELTLLLLGILPIIAVVCFPLNKILTRKQ